MSADAEHVVNVKYDWLAIGHQRAHDLIKIYMYFFFSHWLACADARRLCDGA